MRSRSSLNLRGGHTLKEEPELHEKPDLRHIILKTLMFAVIGLLVYGLLALLVRDHLHAAGEVLSRKYGLLGIGIYCFLVDLLIVPATVDIVYPLAQSLPMLSLLAVMSLASMAGGFLGYLIAGRLDRLSIIHNLTRNYHDQGKALLHHYGGWAVAIAGFTPVPFSTICWIAGLLEVPWYEVLIGCLARIPRMVVYYYLIKGGVSLFGLIHF